VAEETDASFKLTHYPELTGAANSDFTKLRIDAKKGDFR
jgi:hypothetical protein